MKYVTKNNKWKEFNEFRIPSRMNRMTIYVRAEASAMIYVDHDHVVVLAGVIPSEGGEVECELVGYATGSLTVVTHGRCWLRTDEISQEAIEVYGTRFTQIVERARLSPEEERIQRMLKLAKLERQAEMDAFRQEWAQNKELVRAEDEESDVSGDQPAGVEDGDDGLDEPEVAGGDEAESGEVADAGGEEPPQPTTGKRVGVPKGKNRRKSG